MGVLVAIGEAVASFAAGLPTGVSTALSIGGTAVSTIGAISAANAQSRAARYNAEIADRDAEIEMQNRAQALRLAEIDMADKRRENRRFLASMRASYGASGVSSAGSPLDVLEDVATETELDARRIGYEGRARAREAELRRTGLLESASLSRSRGRSSRVAGYFSAAGTSLGGFGDTLRRAG